MPIAIGNTNKKAMYSNSSNRERQTITEEAIHKIKMMMKIMWAMLKRSIAAFSETKIRTWLIMIDFMIEVNPKIERIEIILANRI